MKFPMIWWLWCYLTFVQAAIWQMLVVVTLSLCRWRWNEWFDEVGQVTPSACQCLFFPGRGSTPRRAGLEPFFSKLIAPMIRMYPRERENDGLANKLSGSKTLTGWLRPSRSLASRLSPAGLPQYNGSNKPCLDAMAVAELTMMGP